MDLVHFWCKNEQLKCRTTSTISSLQLAFFLFQLPLQVQRIREFHYISSFTNNMNNERMCHGGANMVLQAIENVSRCLSHLMFKWRLDPVKI